MTYKSEKYLIEVETGGPSGTLRYIEGANIASFYWEFLCNNQLLYAQGPSDSEWSISYPWAQGRQKEILLAIGQHFIVECSVPARAVYDYENGVVTIEKLPSK